MSYKEFGENADNNGIKNVVLTTFFNPPPHPFPWLHHFLTPGYITSTMWIIFFSILRK